MSTPFPVLSRNDHNHKLLRSESCSGYTDVFGNWNTGFYCPQSESKAAVYCCGTETYKYCCTAKDPNDEGTVDASLSPPYSIRTPLIIGVVSGLLFLAFFVTLATCFFCPCCLFHKKRTANIPSGLYRLQCGTSSTTSPLVNNTNSHSSNLNSFTRLPLDYGNGNFYGQQQPQQHPEEQNFGYPTNGFHFHPGNSFSHNPNPNNIRTNSPSVPNNNNGNPGSGSFVPPNSNQYDHLNSRNLMQNMNQTQQQQQNNFGAENGRNDPGTADGTGKENENGNSSTGNGFTTPVTTTTRMTASPTANSTLPSVLSQKFSTLPKQNGQVKFSGLPLSTSLHSTEPPVTSFCEILTVL